MKKQTRLNEEFKIRDIAYLNELSCEIVEYYPKNDEVCGKIYVTGSYRSSRNDLDKILSLDVPFKILLESNNMNILDVDCNDFEYSLVEGVGLKTDFVVNITYEEDTNDSVLVEDKKEDGITKLSDSVLLDKVINKDTLQEVNDLDDNRMKLEVPSETSLDTSGDIEDNLQDESEVIKTKISDIVDEKLSQKLDLVTDNLPTEDEVVRSIKDDTSSINVYYYSDMKDLDMISKESKVSVESIYKQNKQNDIDKFLRVVVSSGRK